MAPNETINSTPFAEKFEDESVKPAELPKVIGTDYNYTHQIVWPNALGFLFLHVMALWGFALVLTGQTQINTMLWVFAFAYFSSEGVTIGAHRLFAHKTFTASPGLKLVLLIAHTTAGQNSMFIWCRDHRLHHRYTDTDGDPHNSKRGFFFCHIGWLMTKKNPLVLKLGRQIDMTDLTSDWMVMANKKYYYYWYVLFAILIPVFVPIYFWNENWKVALLVSYFFRYVAQLNGTWLVNSAAHLYGTRPYDRNIQAVESWFVSFISLGEGWHNYHHTFPWDYKAAELTTRFNQSAQLIEFFEKMGWARDLKTANPRIVENRIVKFGDGTHYKLGNEEAKSKVKVSFGMFHPLNPSYNVTYDPPSGKLKREGLPLFHEDDVIKNDDGMRGRNSRTG